jgi:hypothetical protein
LFLLSGRPGPGGSDCGGTTGTSARTLFVIHAGKIVDWFRAPSEPGDPGYSGAPSTGTSIQPPPTTNR